MSSIPTNQQALLDAIQEIHDKLMRDYASIPEAFTRIEGIEGNLKGTRISVSDTLAYLIGWGKLVLKWYSGVERGDKVDFPETGYKWNELGRLAQSFHQQYRNTDYESLIKEYDETVSKIIALIKSLDDNALYGVPWYEKWTLGRMIQFNTSSPMKNMRQKVRKFKREKKIT